MTKIFKRVCWTWKRFWGYRYRIIEDEKVIREILIYHRKIYILKSKEDLK